MKGILRRTVNALYPPVCPACGEISVNAAGGGVICETCRKQLKYIGGLRCLRCGKPVTAESVEYCFDCAHTAHAFTQGVGIWSYTEEMKASMYRFKYQNKREYAAVYAKELQAECGEVIRSWEAEALIPVPLHLSKLRSRGYNQAEVLADAIGMQMGIPVDTSVLERCRKTLPQKELNDQERFRNLEKAFKIVGNVVKYKKIILVDDIYTTGATIDACAKQLLAAGAQKIYYAAVCIGKGF